MTIGPLSYRRRADRVKVEVKTSRLAGPAGVSKIDWTYAGDSSRGVLGMAESARLPWGQRLSSLLGHHAVDLLVATIVAVVAVQLVPLPPLMALTVSVTLFALVLLCWLLMRDHDRRLCEQCVMSMPLNPSEQAKRYQRRFWMAHTGAEPRFFVPYIIVLISSNFAMSTIGRIGWGLIQLSMIYLLLAQSTHRKLQPWCPWCQGGGGGEEVDETPPVLPHDDRQLI
jgi:hypothetical protein